VLDPRIQTQRAAAVALAALHAAPVVQAVGPRYYNAAMNADRGAAQPGPATPPPLDASKRRTIEERIAGIPLARTFGVRLLGLGPGTCDLALDDRRDLDGIFASLHGGILATLADSAIAFAFLTLMDPGETITTVELGIRFLAPCREAVVARSRAIKVGRTLLTGHIDVVGEKSGTLFAIVEVTYMRLGDRGSRPGQR
jgi:uncharacterized protein (TIGR00369 family)